MNGIMDWFTSPIQSAKDAYNSVIQKWQDALTALDAAVADFNSVGDDAAADPDLSAMWQTANSHLSMLTSTINGANDAISTIVGWFNSASSAVGLSGNQLGALPVLAWIAIVTAAVATVWGVVNELRSVYVAVQNKKISDQNIQNSQNGAPLVPYMDDTPPGGGIIGGISSITQWIAIGVIGFMALKLLEGKRR